MKWKLKILAIIFLLTVCSCKSSQNNKPPDEAPAPAPDDTVNLNDGAAGLPEDLKETVGDTQPSGEEVQPSEAGNTTAFGESTVTTDESASVPTPGDSVPEPAPGESVPVDSDGDGVADGADNCPNIPNENQEDYNANGIADACEVANFSAEDVCKQHLHWWKIDNYKKWRDNPAIYPNVKCTKYVDVSKTMSLENGTEENPYNKIQTAVNKAVAGDVICIKPGIYREHHIDEKNEFFALDDYTGLFINKIASPAAPIVIAAIGTGAVIVDSEYPVVVGGVKTKSHRDVGVFINHARYESGNYDFKDRPKFIEIYGLTVQNFKITGVHNRGCCNRFAHNIVKNNGNTIPDVNPSAKFLIEYDADGRIVYGNDGLPKPADYVLTTDKLDNDNDTLIDEADESHEKIDIGRDGIYESNKSTGNMYVGNEIYGNGWYSKKVCADALDSECPFVPPSCIDAQIAYTNYKLFTCDQVKNILIEGTGKDYKCIEGKAYVNFPNTVTAIKILKSSLKDAALDNAWKVIWAGGHGIYSHASESLIIDNIVHDNGGEGLSVRDPMKNGVISSNKIYNNAAKGIYYISSGREQGETEPVKFVNNIITKNEIYNNGICCASNLKAGIYFGPDVYGNLSKGTTFTENYIHDNMGDDFQVQNAYLEITVKGETKKVCPDAQLKNPSLGGCCPKESIIEKNKFEGTMPIGPKYGICTGAVKGGDSEFLNYLKQNNEILEKQ